MPRGPPPAIPAIAAGMEQRPIPPHKLALDLGNSIGNLRGSQYPDRRDASFSHLPPALMTFLEIKDRNGRERQQTNMSVDKVRTSQIAPDEPIASRCGSSQSSRTLSHFDEPPQF